MGDKPADVDPIALQYRQMVGFEPGQMLHVGIP